MSLFDVLRWPISDCPTAKELTNLPANLYNDWLYKANHDLSLNWTPSEISVHYRNFRNFPAERDDILLLRQMIKEYDEPL